MSVKNLGLVVLAFLVSAFIGHRLSQKSLTQSTWAAAPDFSANGLTRSAFSSKGTSQRIIPVEIKFDRVSQDSDQVAVTATFSLPFHFDEKLHYKWELGEGVQIQAGESSGTLDSLLKNKVYEVRILVTHFSLQTNRTIGFEVSAVKDGRRIHGDALVASNVESTFEHLVQNVERLKKEK